MQTENREEISESVKIAAARITVISAQQEDFPHNAA
jgi:hypothetical protein